jgi:IK cytokine
MPDNEHYSNPMAPANYRPHDEGEAGTGHALTNDDFRKLLMTPAAPGSSTTQRYHGTSSSTSQQKSSTTQKGEAGTEASDKRKKKKQYYAKVIREEKAREEERAKKYRDRARERREITVNEDPYDINLPTNTTQQAASTGNYKSVAPDAKGNFDAAARRKQLIDESKFLGGDLEHTHLVKGLDYALLQKVRAEIGPDDIDNDQPNLNTDEHVFVKPSIKITPMSSGTNLDKKKSSSNETSTPTPSTPLTPEEEEEQKLGLKSSMAKNIFRVLFRPPSRRVNELFLPHRMAYIIDLENLNGQQEDENDKGTHTLDDIPTTLIRSKADCPNAETTTTMSNNDIVINKLTQILSYLRHSKRDLKRQKKKGTGIFNGLEPEMNIKPTHDSVNTITNKAKDISMYDEIGDYIPDTKRRSTTNERTKTHNENDNRKKVYFHHESKSNDGKSNHDDTDQNNTNSADAVKSFIRNVHNKYNAKNDEERAPSSTSNKKNKTGFQLKFSDDCYAECYPGTMAEEDVNIDSDDEPDFDKMDMGSKKGPVGRWDFDTAEEYSDYMGQKEAMPKAAFQYGVKMNDGRKTRRGVGPKDEKQKLEREWQQISKIIESKRKGDVTSSNSPDAPASKRTKMT